MLVVFTFPFIQILCNGQLPFIGLSEKVERELAWKVCNHFITISDLIHGLQLHKAHIKS